MKEVVMDKVRYNLSMPKELKIWLQKRAKKENRSLGKQIVHILEKARNSEAIAIDR